MSWDDVIVIASDDDEQKEEQTEPRRDSASDGSSRNGRARVSSASSQEIDITQSDDSEDDLILVSHLATPLPSASSEFNWDDDIVPLSERLQASQDPSSGNNEITEGNRTKRRALHDISDSDADEVPHIGSQIHDELSPPRAPSRSSDAVIMEVESESVLEKGLGDKGAQDGPVPETAENEATGEDLAKKMTKIRTKRSKEEREALRQSKEEQKRRKAIEREVARSCRLADCVRYMKVSLDKNLVEMPCSGEVLDALQQLDVQTNVAELPIERSVLWTRKVVSPDPTSPTGTTFSEIEEEEIAAVLTADRFLYLVAAERQQRLGTDTSGTLSDLLDNVGSLHPGKRPTYFVLGLDKYFSQEKNRQNREHRAQVLGVSSRPGRPKNGVAYDGPSLSRDEIETIVVGLQFVRLFNVHYVDGLPQVAKWLAAFTKAVAEKPFRLEKQRRSLNFLAPGGGGTRKHEDPALVWRSQIEQFPNVGKDVAEAIVARYRSPRALAEAYRSCVNEETARLLLQDIVVRRGDGPLATTRRVGPKLSARIHHFFTSLDADAYFD